MFRVGLFLLLALQLQAQAQVVEPEEKAPPTAPFTSEEDIEYTPKDKKSFIGFLLADDFIGVVERPYAVNDLRQINVYEFEKSKTLDSTRCQELATKVYGSLKSISRKVMKEKIHTSEHGPICQIALSRGNAEDPSLEYHFYAMNLRKKSYGFEFRFKKASKSADEKDILKFLSGLN